MSLFQLGIITDEVSQSLEEAIHFALQHDMKVLELRSIEGHTIQTWTDEQVESIKALIQQNGLSVCALSTPIFKCHLNKPEELQEHIAILHRSIEIAKRLGTSIIRGFSFWAEEVFEDALPAIVEQFNRILPVLEKENIIFALEFDPSVYASNANKVRMILDTVHSPNVMALYDPGNDLWDPFEEIPYPDGYEFLKEKICHIHLKDAVRTPDGVKGVAIGKGEVDYPGLLRRLIKDRYEGYLVVETHYRLQSELTEEQLKRPAGYAFSEGGLAASRECVESLKQLLEGIST
ncbi:Sugar phosphate isomerase/epimerase [Paenibacillus uliginis N3/975]|uniref:Sugar phosphate isomerase/epimerase n=1 Tax=Paenibacillus uliginis N3/975 TaxID=1313296 RepID=A0A1X7HU23_9BACL|nr:sugar phosphate isomerase/epimerase family protein [Paenibacillus uliginis]SMF91915.1 Sugar phosphate isomerase/epimerase [Paenibacillus uliginis N3/975]